MTVLAGRRVVGVGRIRVSSYVAMLYLGCVAGVYSGAAAAEGVDPSRFVLATVGLLVPALAGARLWFVLMHLARYRAKPRRIWRRAEGGSALYGGLVLAVAVSVPVLVGAGLDFWAFWDAAAITMLVGLVFTRVGCLMHGCCAGRETTGRLGVRLPNDRGEWRRRYPAPLLEAGWALLVLAAALAIRPDASFHGAAFAVVVGAYAAGRLVLEPTRETRDMRGNAAVSAALVIAAGIVLVAGWAG